MNVKVSTVGDITVVHDPEDFSPFPVAVRAGDLIFAPGVLALKAEPPEISTWAPQAESAEIYDRLRQVLASLGGEIETVSYLVQNMVGRDKTVPVSSERPRRFPTGYPASTAVGVTDVGSPSCIAQLDCVAYASTLKQSFTRIRPPNSKVGYSESVEVDGMVYLAGVMVTDRDVGVDPERWSWSPVKEHARWLLEHRLKPRLEQAGCRIEDIATIHCHLRNANSELGPLVAALHESFAQTNAAILVSPASELHYLDGRLEITVTAVRPGSKRKMHPILPRSKMGGVFGGPAAVRIDRHVYCSTVVAKRQRSQSENRADYFDPPSAREMRAILEQLSEIAQAAGCSLKSLVRLRIYAEHPASAAAALKEIEAEVGTNVAVAITSTRDLSGWLSPNTIAVDAILYAPE